MQHDLTLLLAASQCGLYAHGFTEAGLQLLQLGRQGARFGLSGLLFLSGLLLHQLLQLTDADALVHHQLSQAALPFGIIQTGQHSGMAHADETIGQQLLHILGQAQQPQQVGYHGAALAQLFSGLLLGIAAALHQRADALSGFDGIQILTLKVFHQGSLLLLAHVHLPHHGGNGIQPGLPGRAPAALAGYQTIPAVARIDDQHRLQNALLPDGGCQLGDAFLVKAAARLIRVWVDIADADLHAACLWQLCLGKEGLQAASQAVLLFLRHPVPLLTVSLP